MNKREQSLTQCSTTQKKKERKKSANWESNRNNYRVINYLYIQQGLWDNGYFFGADVCISAMHLWTIFYWHSTYIGSRMASDACLSSYLGLCACWRRLLLPLASKCSTSSQRRQAADSPYLISSSMSCWTGGTLYLSCPPSSLTTLSLWVNGLWGLNLDCGWSPLPQINVGVLGQFTGICSGMFSRLC